MSLHPQDPPPAIPPLTVTYTVNAIDFRNRTRVIVPCVLAARTTVTGQDPRITWTPGPGFDGTLRVMNATPSDPVLFAIAVQRFDGTRLHPTGIILRQAATIRPNSFVGAWKVNGPDGHPLLILSDNGLEKIDYEFDLLIRDDSGSNYGLLDPRLTNS